MKKILVALIKFYRKFISSSVKAHCIYTPSCSVYALEVLQKHNIFVSVFLIIGRIIRCNPFAKGGFDPPPDRKKDIKWLL